MSTTFAQLGVSEPVAGALAKRGIETPFSVQSMVVPDVLDGRDVLVKSPTGSGKTFAFGVPMADMVDPDGAWPSALVLAPTRELASQIVDELSGVMHARGLKITAVYGGVGIHNQIKQAGRSHVLVATPGRLLDLIERRAVRLDEVDMLVLDEADRMLDMGFKPVVDRIVGMTPDDRQTLLFSATLEGEVGRIASAYTRDARRHEVSPAPEKVGHIEHRFHRVAHEAKVSALVHELGDPKRGLTLVFVRTKRGADRLVKRLGRHDVDAVAMHGDKSQSQREKALARFESGRVKTLVATDVAARGIDVTGR
jgi:ATP-dependent RNA helicase RhlE